MNKVHCAHILVKTKKEAKQIRDKLKHGQKFTELAKKFSTCPSKQQGGDLGTFEKGDMVREFEDAAFVLDTGEVSKPVKSEFGWHVIKRLG